MVDRDGKRHRRPPFLRLLLFGLPAIGIAWLSLSVYLPRAAPALAARVGLKPNPSAAGGGHRMLHNPSEVGEQALERVHELVGREPLAADPYYHAALRALRTGDDARGERLLVEARSRAPRNPTIRLSLLGLYLSSNRIREGSSEIAVLVRLMPQASSFLVPELARVARRPQSRNAVLEALGGDPLMADVLNQLVNERADPDLILQLAQRQPTTAGKLAPWQEKLVTALVERGEVARAYDLWRRFAAVSDTGGLIYDAEFRGLPGPKPFNWELFENSVGVASSATGGLDLEFYGRKSGPLARQLLRLRPGLHEIAMHAEGSSAAQAGQILVKVHCSGGDVDLLNLPLAGLSLAGKTYRGTFVVPARCPAQWLTFAGQAAEFPNTQRARISRLTLRGPQ